MTYRRKVPVYPWLIVLGAASCNSDSGPEAGVGDQLPGPELASPSLPSNQEILAKLYDPHYTVPAGFFVDERASTPGSYTIHHVKDPSFSYELCTDDFSLAAEWEAADDAARQVNGYYVGHTENERYFEFVRELTYDDAVGNIDDVTSPGFARVFKCSYAIRDGVDRTLLTGYAGKLNVRPLAGDALREFVEYFWQFTFFNAREKKVLASVGAAIDGVAYRTLLLAFATTRGEDLCDLVEVVEWRFVADAASGSVQSRFEKIRGFTAEFADGAPRVCTANE